MEEIPSDTGRQITRETRRPSPRRNPPRPRSNPLSSSWFYIEQNRLPALLLLFVAMTSLSGIGTYRKAAAPRANIDTASAMIAADLIDARPAPNSSDTAPALRPRNIHIGPGYGLILFGIALLDSNVATAIDCHANNRRCHAGGSLQTVAMVQLAAAMFGLMLVFALAYRLSASWEIALLTLILVYISSRIGDFAGITRPVIWPPILTYLFMLLVAESQARRSIILASGAGIVGIACALFMPLAIIFVPAAALLLLDAPKQQGSASAVAQAVALIAGAALTIMAVSWLLIPTYDMTAIARQATSQFAERVAYQAMDFKAWLTSLLMPVPLIGGSSRILFARETTDLFVGIHRPGSFAWQGLNQIFPQALAASPSPFGQYYWIASTYMFGQLFSYMATLPSLFMRGVLAGSGLIGLAGLFQLPAMTKLHHLDDRLRLLIVVTGPVVILFIANLLLSANHFFQNPGLVFLYAYAIACVAGRFRS